MREIKFRAWDTKNNVMYDEAYLSNRDTATCYLNIGDSRASYFDGGRAELMQYTGLKDKNGKEIYEGDIVALDNDPIAPVTFEDGSFQLIALRSQGRSPFIQERAKRYEVIGNIFEDKDLLND